MAVTLSTEDRLAIYDLYARYAWALDEGGVGPIRLDKYYYNFGLHFARNTASVASLADLDPDALARAGVSPDSAARLIQVLGGLHVPVTMGGIPRDRTTTTISYLERFDIAPEPRPATQPRGPTIAATVIGKYSQSEALSLSPTVAAASAGKNTNALGGIQGLYTRFFGKDNLHTGRCLLNSCSICSTVAIRPSLMSLRPRSIPASSSDVG